MIVQLSAIVAWLAGAHAVLFGLFWLLLQVPESNAWTLALSALLALLLVVLAAWTELTAVTWMRAIAAREPAVRRWLGALRSAPRRIPAFLAGLAVFLVVFWLTGLAGSYLDAHRGEIDAWLIVRFGWRRTGAVHATLQWIVWAVRYVIGLSLGLSLMVAMSAEGALASARPAWLRAAFGGRRLLAIALALVVLVWLPWQFVYWRPAGLPASSAEATFVGVKLLVVYLLANIGWAVVLRAAATTAG